MFRYGSNIMPFDTGVLSIVDCGVGEGSRNQSPTYIEGRLFVERRNVCGMPSLHSYLLERLLLVRLQGFLQVASFLP